MRRKARWSVMVACGGARGKAAKEGGFRTAGCLCWFWVRVLCGTLASVTGSKEMLAPSPTRN